MSNQLDFDSSPDTSLLATASMTQEQKLDSYTAAHKFMLKALLAVQEHLPTPARMAVQMEQMFVEHGVDPVSEEEMRASLWKAIADRKMDHSPEVLGIRATICILFLGSSEPPSASDALEFFIETFNDAKLMGMALCNMAQAEI